MKQHNLSHATASIGLLLLSMLGCNALARAQTQPEASLTPDPCVVTPATGALATSADVSPPLGGYKNECARGGEEITLMDGGLYILNVPGHGSLINGTWEVTQDQITFTETSGGGGACPRIPGTYKWTFDGKALIFATLDDHCSARAQDWSSGSWTKQP